MAEMTALVAAVYREYNTCIAPGFDDKSPAITSRFELFYDETLPQIAVSATGARIDVQNAEKFPGTHMHDQVHKSLSVLIFRLSQGLQESRGSVSSLPVVANRQARNQSQHRYRGSMPSISSHHE